MVGGVNIALIKIKHEILYAKCASFGGKDYFAENDILIEDQVPKIN